jgi:hypothetical protein
VAAQSVETIVPSAPTSASHPIASRIGPGVRRNRRFRPSSVEATRPASSSEDRCLAIAWRETGIRPASSVAVRGSFSRQLKDHLAAGRVRQRREDRQRRPVREAYVRHRVKRFANGPPTRRSPGKRRRSHPPQSPFRSVRGGRKLLALDRGDCLHRVTSDKWPQIRAKRGV